MIDLSFFVVTVAGVKYKSACPQCATKIKENCDLLQNAEGVLGEAGENIKTYLEDFITNVDYADEFLF